MNRLFNSVTMIFVWVLILAMSFSLYLNSKTLLDIKRITSSTNSISSSNNRIGHNIEEILRQTNARSSSKSQQASVESAIRGMACVLVGAGFKSQELKDVCSRLNTNIKP